MKANHGAAGVDHVTVEEFERDLEANLEKLSQALADGSYRPQAVRRHWITKLGSKEQRPLGIPTVRDRVVQTALRFEQGRKWPRGKNERKLRDTIRAKTRRTHGHSLAATIVELNRTLGGWFAYFQHRHPTTFATLDGGVRTRLRSILRDRHGRTGTGRGADHQRWPNAYFAECGLFFSGDGPCHRRSVLSEVRPPSGEPDAGDPPVRFGGRGDRIQSFLPTPISPN